MTAGADQVPGNVGGVQKTDLTTTEVAFNVTKWRGQWLKMTALGDHVLYVFAAVASNVISDTEALDASSPNAGAPDVVADGSTEHEIVPSDWAAVYLHVKADSGTARFKARPAQGPAQG